MVGGIAVVAVLAAVVVVAWLGGPASGGPVAAASDSPSPTSPPASATPSPSPTSPPASPTPSPSPTPEPTPVLVPAPLTGLLVSPEAALQQPIAVMIDDHAAARPQAGFNAAAVVWQAPVEGGIPRYMLLFQDTIPTDVGPIRSTRQYYIEWAAEWNAMLVHHGGSPQANATLARRGDGSWVWNADGIVLEGLFVWRVLDRFAPHNVMSDGPHLRRLARRLGAADGPIEAAWRFAADGPIGRRPVDGRIVVRYPYETIVYRYDRVSNTYRRSVGPAGGPTRPQVDAADGQVVAPKNVVILRMAFRLLNDRPGSARLAADDVGRGEAWIATNGRTIKGSWRKASVKAPTLLFDGDGKPVVLAAGQTFVQVISLVYDFQIRDGELPVVVPNGAADPG